VVVLPYNPRLPAGELAALRRFVADGGKLLVFYNSDPELAAVMGMKLGAYLSSGRPARWRGIRFVAGAPAHVPMRVAQASVNIRATFPAADGTRVVAVWEDGAGNCMQDPAWTQSDRGAWMSHVLLDDGDTDAKQQMLLAMLAQYDPGVWRHVAGVCLRGAEPVGRFDGFDSAAEAVAKAIGGTGGGAAQAALARAVRLRGESCALCTQGRYGDALSRMAAARAALVDAYASAQRPRADELRGVWEHSGTGLYPGDWDKTCELLAGQGMTDVFVNLLWAGWAHYRSAVLPLSDAGRLYGDQLQACVAAAHKRGLRIHAWKVCWRVDGAKPELLARLRAAGRLQKSDTGAELPWLCPSHPDNIRQEKDAVRELVRLAEVDGIHLDYVRFKDSHYCHCSNCRRAFEAQVGRRVENWPADVGRWPLSKDYRAWRCRQITQYVRDVCAIARAANPRIVVSAAVFGKYPSCVDGVGQDWVTWLGRGGLDFVCPMDYTENLRDFVGLVRSQIALPGAAGRVYPGIGVTAMESRLDAMQVMDQIEVLRQAGAPGFVLFDLNPMLAFETLPLLRKGVTAPR
jgi:uncharacterized lipoprotein YddW (UPF0748 family)